MAPDPTTIPQTPPPGPCDPAEDAGPQALQRHPDMAEKLRNRLANLVRCPRCHNSGLVGWLREHGWCRQFLDSMAECRDTWFVRKCPRCRGLPSFELLPEKPPPPPPPKKTKGVEISQDDARYLQHCKMHRLAELDWERQKPKLPVPVSQWIAKASDEIEL